MRRLSFVRTLAFAAASCALAAALSGCSMSEMVHTFVYGDGQESAAQSQQAEEEEETSYNEITPEIQAQIDALYAQLESLQSQAESEVESAFSSAEASARAEWAALPASERTLTKKIEIIYNNAGELSSIESKYDSEVSAIVDEMRSILSSNGCDTSQARAAWSEYQSAKNAMISKMRRKAGV